jgi:exodeoxyribonuclease-3
MRIISFCARGLELAADRGFYEWVAGQDAEFICIQNLAAQEYDLQADIFFPAGYNAYFFDSVKPKSNGVAIYCRQLPKAIMTGLGDAESDMEGRYIQADFESISIASVLVPRGDADDPVSMEQKAGFLDLLQSQLNKVRNKRRDYVLCGNWNIAHTPADVQDNESCSSQSGFLAEDRQWLDQLADLGYIDAFREVNTDTDEFTWWPTGEPGSNGWRVDYQWVSQNLKYAVEYGAIYKSRMFSDHAPLIMDYDIEL